MSKFSIEEKQLEIIKKQSDVINHALKAYNVMTYLANKVQENKDLEWYFTELKSVIDYSNLNINNAKIDLNNLIDKEATLV